MDVTFVTSMIRVNNAQPQDLDKYSRQLHGQIQQKLESISVPHDQNLSAIITFLQE